MRTPCVSTLPAYLHGGELLGGYPSQPPQPSLAALCRLSQRGGVFCLLRLDCRNRCRRRRPFPLQLCARGVPTCCDTRLGL